MGEISVGCQTAVWGEYRWGHLEETLAGLHFGVRWYDPRAVEEAKHQLLRIVDFLVALGCENLVVSGGGREGGMEADDYRRQAEALDEVGRHCRERGVRLHYHNHGWEVRNDCEGLRRICELSDPRYVSLALDLGNVVIPEVPQGCLGALTARRSSWSRIRAWLTWDA